MYGTLGEYLAISKRVDEVIARGERAVNDIFALIDIEQKTLPDIRKEADEIAWAVSRLMALLEELKALEMPDGDLLVFQINIAIKELGKIDRVVAPISKALHEEYAKE